MKTKFFYYLTENFLKYKDKQLDFSNDHDLYIFSNEIFNLINNNASSVIVNHRTFDLTKTKVLESIRTIAHKMLFNLDVIYELPKIRFMVADMFSIKFHIETDQIFYIFYDKKKLALLPQNAIFIDSEILDKTVFKKLKKDSFGSFIHKNAKFIIQDNLNDSYLEVKSLNEFDIFENDEIVFNEIELTNDFLFEENTIWKIINNLKSINANTLILRNDLTVFDLQKLRKILSEHQLQYIKILSSIETKNCLENIKQIVVNSDGIIFNSQYLCNYEDTEALPFWQNFCIKACRIMNKIVLIQNEREANFENFDTLNSLYATILNTPDGLNYYKNYDSLDSLSEKIKQLKEILEKFEIRINPINAKLILQKSSFKNEKTFDSISKIFDYFAPLVDSTDVVFCLISDDKDFIQTLISCRLFNLIVFGNEEKLNLRSYQYGLLCFSEENILNANSLGKKHDLIGYLEQINFHFSKNRKVFICSKTEDENLYTFKKIEQDTKL